MPKTYTYHAFGLNISSQLAIEMLEPVSPCEADVTICRGDLSGQAEEFSAHGISFAPGDFFFHIPDGGSFRIQSGTTITVDPLPGVPDGLLAVYIMGSCFGAILHQRGLLPLHGSCVAKDGEAVLITGDSGAGKSTLAAEFLRHGWKLLTDDVAVVLDIDSGKPVVQSSYPSQKLWQDAIDRYGRDGETLPLWQEERKEKFSIRVRDYQEGQVPLKKVVRLIPTPSDCRAEPVEGFTKVDQLLRNTYRSGMIPREQYQRHFQRCVTLASAVKMAFLYRSETNDSAETLYRWVTAW